MPNHVQNHLIFDCPQERFQEILRAVCYEPGANAERTGIGTFDFNKLIPMPDHIFRGNLGQEERKLYGKDNWYDWSISHWGTKWNSYSNDCDENSHTLSFQTAWSPPFPVIERLAERYPDVRFTHEWADEDMGYNVGTVEYADGEIAGEDIPDGGSVEAFRMALRVWDYDEEDFGMCENAAHTRFIRMDNEEYEPVDLFGKIMLFSNSRLTDEDIPNGWHLYHLRQNPDTGRFATVEPNVRVDHAGSIVSKEPIDFGERDHIELNDETDPNFLGGTLTFEEYSHLDVFDIDGSPHVLRHTKAMHLLRAGVNMIYIRDFLGHVDIATTETYARIDAEMKRKVFEEKVPNYTPKSIMPWEEDENLLQYLL